MTWAGARWTQQDIATLTQMRSVEGWTNKAIAAVLGRSREAVSRKALTLGIPKARRRASEIDAIVQVAFENGTNIKSVADACGLHHLTVSLAYKELSARLIAEAKPYTPGTFIGAREMAAIVGPILGVTVKAIFSKSRYRPTVLARTAIARALRDRGVSLPVIARAIGGKDHSTVHHLLSCFDAYCRTYPQLTAAYTAIKDAEQRASERLAA
jgi:chromosomal replication initiation ATPase DnaA